MLALTIFSIVSAWALLMHCIGCDLLYHVEESRSLWEVLSVSVRRRKVAPLVRLFGSFIECNTSVSEYFGSWEFKDSRGWQCLDEVVSFVFVYCLVLAGRSGGMGL